MRRTTGFWISLMVCLGVLSGTFSAQAMPLQDFSSDSSPQQVSQLRRKAPLQRIQSFVNKHRLPSFQKNGKLFFATNGQTDVKKYLKKLSPNLVEVMVSPGFHHLYTRVGDKTYSRITNLGESAYYKSGSQRIGVLVHLTDAEMGRLKTYVDSALRDPQGTIGPFNYGGGRPPRASNCTSWLTWAKIGDNGETFARLLGVHESGYPQGFIGSLMNSRSDRVKAVVVHNPQGEFNNSYHFDLH